MAVRIVYFLILSVKKMCFIAHSFDKSKPKRKFSSQERHFLFRSQQYRCLLLLAMYTCISFTIILLSILDKIDGALI